MELIKVIEELFPGRTTAERIGVFGVDEDEDSSEPLLGVFNADLRNFVTVLNDKKRTDENLSIQIISRAFPTFTHSFIHSVSSSKKRERENGKSHADRY